MCDTLYAIAPNTPSGVRRMIMSVYLNIVCAIVSKSASNGLPRSPTRVRLMPNRVANTTTGKMSPFAACSTTLDGNKCSAVSQPLSGLASSTPVFDMSSGRRSPGRKTFPMASPIPSANVVTSSK
jgi:hypothetical protein